MIIQLKNASGGFEPLDVFDDFEIRYNHQYEDYNSISGGKIPYTNKIKLPLTNHNRILCGVPFDVTYPLSQSINGRVLYNNGTVAFNFIADIERQVVNVLEPYIEISIIDLISKAISDLSKYKMSDLYAGESFNIKNDTWVYGSHVNLTDDQSFILPFYNFNNKRNVFAFDSARGINQLQPTFILNKLVSKIFNYVGIDINSIALNSNNQLLNGVNANEFGISIPCELKTLDNYDFTAGQYFTGSGYLSMNKVERIAGVPTPLSTTSRLRFQDWITNGTTSQLPLKFNYDYLSDSIYNGQITPDTLGGRMCSMVNGKMKLTITPNEVIDKVKFYLGQMAMTSTTNQIHPTSVISTGVPNLDVKIVMMNGERFYNPINGWTHEMSTEYNIDTAQKVGTATYLGYNFYSEAIEYEFNFSPESVVTFDVEANQDIELAFIVTPQTDSDVVIQYTATSPSVGGQYTFEAIIKHGWIEYKLIDSSGVTAYPDADIDLYKMIYTRPIIMSWLPSTFKFSFEGATDIPSGFTAEYNGFQRNSSWINNINVDMAETMKSIKDYSLIEILKMIMERYNLKLFSKSNGTIHLDSAYHRSSHQNLIIDHLIHEDIEVEFTSNDNGILSIKDENPSFYKNGFNALDKYEISDVKKEEVRLDFKSAIVNEKMFEDTYYGGGYELLKYGRDSNYWGVGDRLQVKPKDLKPTFCLLKSTNVPVYFPYNICDYATYLTNPVPDDLIQTDFGFFNVFHHIPTIHPVLQTEATNMHPTSKFSLISFKNNDLVAGNNNLYKSTLFQQVMDKMNDESVVMSVEFYVSEDTLQMLLDFPDIIFRGQKFVFQGFNGYPLSSEHGGLTKITVVRLKDWNPARTILISTLTGGTSGAAESLPANRTLWTDAVADPVVGSKIYTSSDKSTVLDGFNLYWNYNNTFVIQVSAKGTVVAVFPPY